MDEKRELLVDLTRANFILFDELSSVLSGEQLEKFVRRAIERAVENCDRYGCNVLKKMEPSEITKKIREAVENNNDNHYHIRSEDDGNTFLISEDTFHVKEPISQEIDVENADLVGMSRVFLRVDQSFEEWADSAGVLYRREPELKSKLVKASERVATAENIEVECETWEFEDLALSIIEEKLGITISKSSESKKRVDEEHDEI